VKKNVSVNLLTDPLEGRLIFRSTNIMVCGWVGEKYTCLDVIEVFPLVRLMVEIFTVGRSCFKAASSKMVNHVFIAYLIK
jgi:hypothetical protein